MYLHVMKNKLCIGILLCFILTDVFAQPNHVPNHSFEVYTGCPSAQGQISCSSWYNYTLGNPDYFNSCSSGGFSVPSNFRGWQQAEDGIAYCGFLAYYAYNYYEYLATPIQPLQPGIAYDVSMSVSLSESSKFASKGIGVYFFDNGLTSRPITTKLNIAPQVWYTNFGYITDTATWVRLTARYVADSAYDNMVVGGFGYSPIIVDSNGMPGAYYYLDSVVIRKEKSLRTNNLGTLFCPGDSSQLTCLIVNSNIVFNSSNVFTVQLSNSTGSFSSPVNIGSVSSNSSGTIPFQIPANTSAGSGYRIRIVSTAAADTSAESANITIKPLPANFSTSYTSTLCEGDTIYFSTTTTSSGVTRQWVGPASFSSALANPVLSNISFTNNGKYIVTGTLNQCSVKDSVTVSVKPKPANVVLSHNSPVCINETLQLTVNSISGASYLWSGPGSFSSTGQGANLTNVQLADSGIYRLRVTGSNGCSSFDSLQIKVNPIPFVTIYATPGDSICSGDPVLFKALPNNWGGAPTYQWLVNGTPSGTGSTLNTAALNNGDIVHCNMTEYTKCNVPYIDISNDINMKVLPWLAPTVVISASPSYPVNQYEYITFTATTTDAGSQPSFQWKRNGKDVIGATGSVWTANSLNDNDSIRVEVISNYKCPQPNTASSKWIKVKLTGVVNTDGTSRLSLFPNPNDGRFVISGILSSNVQLNIINALGQTVYHKSLIGYGKAIQEDINLSRFTKGMYLLQISSDASVDIIKFTIK